MTRTREQVRESFLLDEVRRACEEREWSLRLFPPVLGSAWDVQVWHAGRPELVHDRPTLADALADIYADLKGEPAPPLPSAEEVREARRNVMDVSETAYMRAALRAMHASDDAATRLLARCVVEVGDE